MSLDTQTLPLPLVEPALADTEDARFWLETTTFAELSGIHRTTALAALKRCYAGGTWHKAALRVRLVASVGGNQGQAYQVFAPSLPVDLANAWAAKHPALFKKTEVPKERVNVPTDALVSASNPNRLAAIKKGQFLEALIMPAMQQPKYSKGRGEAIRGICAAMPVTFPNGKTWTYDERGISTLVAKYEKGGLPGLIRGPRCDKSPRRVIVCRSFDKIAPFSDTEKAVIWGELSQHIKNLFLGTHNTNRQIERLANVRLVELARGRGWAEASLDNCEVGIAQVRLFAPLRKAAYKSMDAKRFADHIKPRVMRGRAGLRPMEIVMGDVHYVDILNQRVDESHATARMVTWLDLATNRAFYNLFLLDKGRGTTQTHVAYSFVQMVRAWGLPSILYLDNGSEYVWQEMMEGFSRLSDLARSFGGEFNAYCMPSADVGQRFEQADSEDASYSEDPRAVVRSTPHNPPGKAPVEGLFGILERTVFCAIPGWIGGDRMNKKTHKVGKAPRAFKGDWQQFEASFATAMDFYHSRPQKDGSSPNEKFTRHVKAGWKAVDVDYVVLTMALAERKQYKVLNTGIEISDVTYWHDVMATPYVMGEKVIVYYAKWDTDQIVILPRDTDTGKLAEPLIAYRARIFGMVEKAGAIESGRRISIMNKGIRDVKKGSSPVDAVAEMGKYVQLSPPATVVPFGPKITLPEEFKGVLEAAEQAGEPPKVEEVRLLAGQWLDRETRKVRSMYEQASEREADPVDNWEAEERARLIQKARNADALGSAEKNDLSGSRLTGQSR